MTSLGAVAVISGLTAVGLSLWFVPAYRRFRGRRIITCPETKAPAEVEVNAARFAATSLSAHPALRLKDCSLWPERGGCGQDCLAQV